MLLKHSIFIFISIIYSGILFSQNDTVYISGKVFAKNSYRKPESIKKAYVHLKLSNGEEFESLTNDTGLYSFKINTIQTAGFINVATDKNSTFQRSRLYGCFPSKDIAKFDFSEKRMFIRDFELTKITPCLRFPTILFKPNTTEPSVVDYENKALDEVMNQLYTDLIDNPEIIIEIRGSCDSKEKNDDELSLKRANIIADKLLKKGINKQRLYIKALGYQAEKATESALVKKTEKEKEQLHQRQRSVNFRVVSWDFLDPNFPISDKSKSKEESEFIED